MGIFHSCSRAKSASSSALQLDEPGEVENVIGKRCEKDDDAPAIGEQQPGDVDANKKRPFEVDVVAAETKQTAEEHLTLAAETQSAPRYEGVEHMTVSRVEEHAEAESTHEAGISWRSAESYISTSVEESTESKNRVGDILDSDSAAVPSTRSEEESPILSLETEVATSSDEYLEMLRMAIQQGRLELLKQTAKSFDDLGAIRFEGGLSPLHLAVIHGHPAIVKYLLLMPGVSVSVTDSLGRSPLDWAALEKSEDVRRLLQSHVEGNSAEPLLSRKKKKTIAGRLRSYSGSLFTRRSSV